MAIDPVLFQAAATIVAGRIQARATKNAASDPVFGIASRIPIAEEMADVYRSLQKAEELITAQATAGGPAESSMTMSEPPQL